MTSTCFQYLGEIHDSIQHEIHMYIDQTFSTQSTLSLGTLADWIENKIEQTPGIDGLAFPVNLSKNEIVAHAVPSYKDKEVFNEKDILKIDFGFHQNGYLIDAAFSYTQDPEKQEIIRIAEEATAAGIKMIRMDQRLVEIGEVIQEIIESGGYRSIWEVCGHSIDRYRIHAGQAVPNCRFPKEWHYEERVRSGFSYSVETFPTTGNGQTITVDVPVGKRIYMRRWKMMEKTVKNWLEDTYKGLAFSYRTLYRDLHKEGKEENWIHWMQYVTKHPEVYESFSPIVAIPEKKQKTCIVAQVENNVWIDPMSEVSYVLKK